MKVDIQPSIDDFGVRFNYNRHPAVWEKVEQNLIEFKNKTENDNIELSISTTVSAFTIYYLPEFFKKMSELGMPKPWLGRLHRPEYYRPGVFPEEVKKAIKEKLIKSKNIDILKTHKWLEDNDSKYYNKFLEMIDLHDKYRKESFVDVFTELANLLKLS